MMTKPARAILVACVCVGAVAAAQAQTVSSPAPSRPVGRASVLGMASRTSGTDLESWNESSLNLAFTLRQADQDDRPYDYGIDLRYFTYAGTGRPARTSVYEAFGGAKFADGSLWVRGGNMWLNDLGALGSVAGGAVEYRQSRQAEDEGRFRYGVFGGLEPNILDVGYVSDVTKFGSYVTYEGKNAHRDTLGYVLVRNAGMTERSVVTTTNYVPFSNRFFVYQAAEVDVSRPAGQAERGLTYIFATARVVPSERVDVQGLYQHGHSIDARGLVESLTTGRPLAQQALTGLLFESVGGRATINLPGGAIGSPTVYAGYYKDHNDERAPGLDRIAIGGQLANIAGRGIDVTASDSTIAQTTGTYHSSYFSAGKQLGDRIYVSGDYSTSLAIVRFTPSSGITVETRPRTVRWSAMANVNLTRAVGLLAMAERTSDESYLDVRFLSGLTYRIR